MKLVFHLTPRWVTHQNMMLLLVSDLYFLNIMVSVESEWLCGWLDVM